MLSQLFPQTIDNNFRGHFVALWLFVPVTTVKLWAGLQYLLLVRTSESQLILVSDQLANQELDFITLVVAQMGLAQLLLGLLFSIVILRYRSMVPLMYALLLIEYLVQDGIGIGGSLNADLGISVASLPTVIVTMMGITGFVLSLRHERDDWSQ